MYVSEMSISFSKETKWMWCIWDIVPHWADEDIMSWYENDNRKCEIKEKILIFFHYEMRNFIIIRIYDNDWVNDVRMISTVQGVEKHQMIINRQLLMKKRDMMIIMITRIIYHLSFFG